MNSVVRVVTGYRFFPVSAPAALRDRLEAMAQDAGVLGTLLVAGEGVNLSMAGTPDELAAFRSGLARILGNALMPSLQESPAEVERPFRRLRVRLREEIVALGRPRDLHEFEAATEVSVAEWEALLADPEVPVIDVRNSYETAAGGFQGAIDPATRRFRDFPAWVEAHLDPEQTPAVAMYCTGGIRCTKAAAWMRGQGFERVYELGGGILRYLAEAREQAGSWQGECFVFDERISLLPGLEQGTLQVCEGCGQPVDPEARKRARFDQTERCESCQQQGHRALP